MSIAIEKVAVVLALPEDDRAFLARQLIASLDDAAESDAETQWQAVIDRRSREIVEGNVSCRPVEQVVRNIRNKLLRVVSHPEVVLAPLPGCGGNCCRFPVVVSPIARNDHRLPSANPSGCWAG
jgi:putative addiction module component (TIGR02574 family)